ncbi:ParB/RepB/Spo0J family partition protein [Sulfurovum sp. zt1-1]|uniref:ParB/RepB/Spo0J family partition protein n=1 Tax=Sulfurovum zhangzhouensis TaxID=3019067 RepID=A0ABT7QW86_9BACT|nr:ParB/RepB/Spo0J family partition protein [Sulfurovum zhangzhouensis]MDM5271099.1 ParB/RepB/Spo0J family partition protein [Sulfurovum zhangzhouensis]
MALGRGLGEILSEVEEAYAKDLSSIDSSELEAQGARVAEIEVSTISPNPFQPRKHFDEKALQELSESIKEHGLLQPIVVIEKGDGYMLIAGERRLRAHKLANLPVVKAIIADVDIDDIRLRELALIENIQRENLNPIELANSYAELIEVHGIRHEDLSDIVHKSRSQITNTMRLLTLSDYAQEQLVEGNISQGHAKVLVGLDALKQKVIIDSIVGQKLSVREAENIVKNYKNNNEQKSKTQAQSTFMDDYKAAINAALPFKHKIKSKSVEISFSSSQEIENFLSILKKA